MSTATAAATAADAAPAPARGKKKLIIIVAAAVLVLALGGVGALLLLKKQAQAHDEDADGPVAAAPATLRDPKSAPAFVPLDPFTVNLADKQADRYAQVAITLELADPSVADSLKAFMPAVRNNILMVLAHKTSAELLERDGKTKLASDIRRESARAMGVAVPDEDGPEAGDEPPRKKGKNGAKAVLPVSAVYFSTFIIQ
jgi:flagellar FliL protein